MARILLFGQARFGAEVLAGLLERGHEITAVSTPCDQPGGGADALAGEARARGLELVQRSSFKSPEARASLDAGRADLAVLAFVTQIIPVAVLDAPRLASVCFHPSLLPAYRGGSAINWQLINGEKRGGITLFRPDSGIDAGPIYLQRELEIGDDQSSASYYYATVFEPGVSLTLETVEMILTGEVEAVAQDETLASHDPLCSNEHAVVDWGRPGSELHNLVRGCDPNPGAHCWWKGTTLRFYGSQRGASERVAEPGTVLGLSDQGLEVATADGSLVFAKLKAGGPKAAAAEVARSCGLQAGERL